MIPFARHVGAVLLAAAALCVSDQARAASCPSTCVTFDAESDARQFLGLVANGRNADMTEFLRTRMALHAARILPSGTQFVLLSEYKVEDAKSSYYSIHLPGADLTKYLVAVK